MILTKQVLITIHNSNLEYYKNILNDKTLSKGNMITIDTNLLSKGNHTLIDVSCDNCNNIKNMEYRTYIKCTNNLTVNYYCNKCKNIKTKETNLIKYGVDCVSKCDEIKNKSKQTNLNKYGTEFSSQNINVKNKVKETNLNKHGVTTTLLLCDNKHNKNHDKLKETRTTKYSKIFYDRAINIHNNIFTYLSPYIKIDKQIHIKCNICDGDFYQKPKDHIHNKQGCPYCLFSKGEKQIISILNENNINYISQYKFDNCIYKKQLKFDFYLPEHNICIEYDGEQHFKKFYFENNDDNLKIRQLRDNIKTEYCKNNNIILYRITYQDNIENEITNLINNLQ